MIAEFEEREFEAQLNWELSSSHQCPYAPGQVLENTIGIDAALVCQDTNFWKLFQNAPRSLYPAEYTPAGFQLNAAYWHGLDAALPLFPPIKFNLFLQHKRPDYLCMATAKEWGWWHAPYYRFHLLPHQQEALEELANLAGDDALVAYSCPAFHMYDDLWSHAQASTLVSATNFVPAASLTGHSRYTFKSAGCDGIGHSDPEEVPGFDMPAELDRLRERDVWGDNRERLFSLAQLVDKALARNVLRYPYQRYVERFSGVGDIPSSGRALLEVASFARVTESKWYFGLAKQQVSSTWRQ
jgi:hypothetical protein